MLPKYSKQFKIESDMDEYGKTVFDFSSNLVKGYWEVHFGIGCGPPIFGAGEYGRIFGRKLGRGADLYEASGLIMAAGGTAVTFSGAAVAVTSGGAPALPGGAAVGLSREMKTMKIF